ncbi:CpaF/VirB11 family protein [Heyndrickxia camelliae]|uniref:Type II/IV secretion system protein n=1 Tax=Heyndrickxia camelliae TaxID=1707093 RepID=A0A2N3LEQ3_9BACI|nr:CpaF/VirB11 family protein [Heyndrickxia camelliae]PKR83055.1 type II/IV secretion system protein [Heyndrickxia camelliae]
MNIVLSDETIDTIRTDLREHHAELYRKAYSDSESREVLKSVLLAKHKNIIDSEEKAESVLREIVGFSFIEDLIEDNRITDIGFNGTDLIVEGNGISKYKIESVTEADIHKLIAKFANSTNRELTAKDPILNTSKDRLRLNAVHKQNAPYGTTMAIRVSRPYLALNEENWNDFAPNYILDFCKAAVKTRSNMIIVGETGTGKTEFQKTLISWIPFEERIALIEGTLEMCIKELFPDKDIFSWVASNNVTIEQLISLAGLRSHPVWIIVGEILGREVYQMLQGILTGHRFITTGHAVDARAIPKRLLGMAKMGYQVDDKMFLDDIYNYVDFGFHLKKRNGRRFLSEIVEFNSDHTATTVFKQVITKDGLKPIIGKLSNQFHERLIEFDCDYEGLPAAPIEEGIRL